MSDEPEKVEGEARLKTADEVAQEALNERVNGFLKEYGELVGKWKMDFATYPMFVPDGQGGFKILTQSTPVDMTNQPIRSDFMQTNK